MGKHGDYHADVERTKVDSDGCGRRWWDPPLQTLLKHASVPNELIKIKINSNPPFFVKFSASTTLLLYYCSVAHRRKKIQKGSEFGHRKQTEINSQHNLNSSGMAARKISHFRQITRLFFRCWNFDASVNKWTPHAVFYLFCLWSALGENKRVMWKWPQGAIGWQFWTVSQILSFTSMPWLAWNENYLSVVITSLSNGFESVSVFRNQGSFLGRTTLGSQVL